MLKIYYVLYKLDLCFSDQILEWTRGKLSVRSDRFVSATGSVMTS